jgi:hypothetical protein
MTVFAEALLKSDGSPPAFDGGEQKSYLSKLSGARRALASAGHSKTVPKRGKPMPRITDTYVFRDAQYFASHSTQAPSDESSLVVLHADSGSIARADPGGVSLVFAHGEKDLLIGAAPQENARKKNRGVRFDAALRNGYRINGAGYSDQDVKLNRARLVKSWRGPGWAAAKSVDETNPAGSIARTVFHLKAQHALVVVDELATPDGAEAEFEQFWHLAPGLNPEKSAGQISLAIEGGGTFTAAFNSEGTVTMEAEGEGGNCLRRSIRLTKGVAASLFQWSEAPAIPTALTVANDASGGWSLEIKGSIAAHLILAGDELRYEPAAT